MKKIFLLACTVSLLVSGCYLYHPMMVDVPLMREQGELQLSASSSINATDMGANATATWAPVNHLAVQAFGDVSLNGDYYMQAGIGGFLPMANGWTMELYGNAGKGYGSWTGDDNQEQKYSMWSHYQIYSLQPNFGHVGETLDWGLGVKCGMVCNSTIYTGRWIHGDTQNREEYLDEHHLLVEPTAMLRFGWEHIKISLHLGYAYISGTDDADETSGTETRHFRYNRVNVGLGVTYRF